MPPTTLTLSVRLYDPLEKKNAKLAASWIVTQIPREALDLTPEAFAAQYLTPRLKELEHFAVRMAEPPQPESAPNADAKRP